MRPYDPKRSCEKCGCAGRKIRVDRNNVVVMRVAANTEYIPDNNLLLRTCKRCGYQWPEFCVDEE